MSAIFLSAGLPRGNYHLNSDPFLIHIAVREFMNTVLGRHLIVWGGHPAITPMVWAACEDLGVDFSSACILYQSNYYADLFPEENKRFKNTNYIDAIPNDEQQSLFLMRQAMLSRNDLSAAVFIGGMEGIFAEYELFSKYHPDSKIVTVA